MSMFHWEYANATHVLVRKSSWYKLKNMGSEPNSTHVPSTHTKSHDHDTLGLRDRDNVMAYHIFHNI